jgi:hypothetical protein
MTRIGIIAGLTLSLAAQGWLVQGAQAQAPTRAAAHCCRLPAGTVVTVELAQAVDAQTVKPGDAVALRLAIPVTANGQILLPAGTPGVGEVIEAAKPGLGGKAAKLVLAARSLRPPGRARIPLKALQLSSGGQGHQTAATALGLAGIGFAPLGFVGFAIHGGDVIFPAGTRASAKLSAAITLRPLGRAPRAAPGAAPEAAGPEAIEISPPPPGEGQVVFFRGKSILGTGQWFNVREDEKPLGRLNNGAYFVTPAAPGLHTYTATTEPEFKDRLTLKIDAGETYFVEGVLTKGVVIGVADLTPSDHAAFDAAKGLKPADPPGQEPPKAVAQAKSGQ